MRVLPFYHVLTVTFLCGTNFPPKAVSEAPETWWKIGQSELENTLKVTPNQKYARNVIIFVGDGMGLTTITAARIRKGQLNGQSGEEGRLHFETFPYTGILKPYSNDMQVSESSASGTALFTGMKVNSETIGLNSNAVPKQCRNSSFHQIDGIMTWAQEAGKATGFVTSSRVADSTPASLYAHVPEEDWEADADIPFGQWDPASCKDITAQLVDDLPGKNFNVILGGGRRNFLPKWYTDPTTKTVGRRLDGRSLIREWEMDKMRRGVKAAYVTTREELTDVSADTSFVLGLFNDEVMTYAADTNSTSREPSLTEMAAKAVKILDQNPAGYLLVVEGGLIDDAHHRGLAAKALEETIQLDDSVKFLDDLTNNSDTLLVVAADHSHSLLFLGYQKRGNPILGLGNKKVADEKPYTSLLYASGNNSSITGPRVNISGHNTEHKDYHQQAFIPARWAMHTGEDVPVYAKGPMSHLFTGVHEQHYLAHAVNYAACYRNDTLTACHKGTDNSVSL